MNNKLNGKRTTSEQQVNTNNNIKNIYYINIINKYREENPKNFFEKMKFFRKVKLSEEYLALSYKEQTDIQNYILGDVS